MHVLVQVIPPDAARQALQHRVLVAFLRRRVVERRGPSRLLVGRQRWSFLVEDEGHQVGHDLTLTLGVGQRSHGLRGRVQAPALVCAKPLALAVEHPEQFPQRLHASPHHALGAELFDLVLEQLEGDAL
ncbi:MAG TPA: hypothetical protein PLG36_05025 [Trueperaceae bacterium]|nr:hypothetical protein [Trueperaceae bacterium]